MTANLLGAAHGGAGDAPCGSAIDFAAAPKFGFIRASDCFVFFLINPECAERRRVCSSAGLS
jgi:hypothetical protein